MAEISVICVKIMSSMARRKAENKKPENTWLKIESEEEREEEIRRRENASLIIERRSDGEKAKRKSAM